MIEKVEKVVNYIEDHYHSELGKDNISCLTGHNYDYFRRKFKEIVGLSLDKYRIRRQLTLIIQEIYESKTSINKNNLLPWKDDNSFRVAFKKEFSLRPNDVLQDFGLFPLQDKFELIDKDELTIQNLINECGSPVNALRYLLSLRPYSLMGLSLIFDLSVDDWIEEIIRNYYGRIPQHEFDRISKHFKRFYDIENKIVLSRKIPPPKLFIIVKRNLIDILLEKYNLSVLFPINQLRTIWYYEDDIVKTRNKNQGRALESIIIAMPNELIDQKVMPFMDAMVLHDLIFQDCGALMYESLEQLRDRVKFNYNKPIESQDIDEDDFERLENDELVQILNRLLFQGLLYLKP